MSSPRNVLLVTGGAGFIGSALVRYLLRETDYTVVTLDALTYAGNIDSLAEVSAHPRHHFVHGDIGDSALVRSLLEQHQPAGVLHLAAESHVDRSIDGPGAFVHTNIVGTFALLQEARRYWDSCQATGRPFRFLHVSTDEVFGSLPLSGESFTAESRYLPSSPYSASKAASDHLVRAWGHTYGLPIVITNCSNNYGPYQFPEKLIPLTILNAVAGMPLPVYGTGENVRDWLFVDDHAHAIRLAFERGTNGATYLVGGDAERTNISVVNSICDLVDARLGRTTTRQLITRVADRPGHDLRYAINASATRAALGWAPSRPFEQGLAETVDWYIANRAWADRILSGAYRLERLGLGVKQGVSS
jgi:dTDP-glucose 4,6-dehydratase